MSDPQDPTPPAAESPPAAAPAVAPASAPVPTPAPTPATGEARDYALHPAAVRLWTWQSWILAACMLVPTGFIAAVSRNALWLGFGALVALLVVVTGRRYVRAYAERFRCALLEDGVLVARGVWWRKESFIPRTRIQHTDVNEGPLARALGIAQLKVYTAGTQLGSIEVEGLPRDDAYALRDRLLGRRGHDGV